MVDMLLILLATMSIATVTFAIEYCRQLRRVQKEYERARSSVEDLILSFNRELKRDAQRLELVAYKVEETGARENEALKKAEDVERQMSTLLSQQMSTADIEGFSKKIDEIDKRVLEVVTSHKGIVEKITALEQQSKEFTSTPEISVEGIIPVKRDKAIALLTQTELATLEFLASYGAKATPEIKEQVKLSREHTARLMKKLYEKGYLERDTSKIPFKYSVKKEMEKLLKKVENETTNTS